MFRGLLAHCRKIIWKKPARLYAKPACCHQFAVACVRKSASVRGNACWGLREVRLLSALYAELGDWRLALLAFNAGDEFVERAINQEGTRDAFRLTELGHENDRNYLARVMAAIIIMKNEDQLSLE